MDRIQHCADMIDRRNGIEPVADRVRREAGERMAKGELKQQMAYCPCCNGWRSVLVEALQEPERPSVPFDPPEDMMRPGRYGSLVQCKR